MARAAASSARKKRAVPEGNGVGVSESRAGEQPEPAASTTARRKRVVSDEHKAAMAQGRTEGRAVSAYLDALQAHRPKRGRKRTAESIDKRLAAIATQLSTASPVKRLGLIQERLDLQRERETLGASVDLSELEAGFAE